MDVVSTIESRVLKSQTITDNFSLQFVNVCFIYLGALMLGAHIFVTVIASWWINSFIIIQYILSFVTVFDMKSILYKYSYPVFFWCPFARNTFFQPSTWNLYMFLNLKWWQIVGHTHTHTHIHLDILSLLIEEFNTIIFKAIIIKKDLLLSFCQLFSVL